jgi:SNF2 family DNA or RNA helicase
MATTTFSGRLIAPYQHDGVKWLLSRELAQDYKGGLLCDEMGLGKTVQMLATMAMNFKPHISSLSPSHLWDSGWQKVKNSPPK